MDRTWYKRWFGETYKQLYPHRDVREAEAQVRFVLRALPVTPEWRILDIGCGPGRHLDILRKRGHVHCEGLDLSMPLLRDARAASLNVARGDMRHLPFRPASFDLVTSFFTSFGYFATFAEDVETLAQFVSVLKPGGYLFLDLINKRHLIKHLVSDDRKVVEGSEVIQSRRLEGLTTEPGTVVVKEIEIRRPGGETERFVERVRLYELETMLELAKRFRLRHVATFGDETGAAWRPDDSPRMAMLLQRMPPDPEAI
ncbi:MAG: Methyltransferase protein [Fibrobacteres bacterium]|nr:Methyltransferase protein [Fibrobacterota bacterium]